MPSQLLPMSMAQLLGPLRGRIGPRIMTELTEHITRSVNMTAENGENRMFVRDPHPPCSSSGERLYRVTNDSRECGLSVSTGLPCAQLICVHRELANGEFPVFLINRRWFIGGHEPDFPRLELPWDVIIPQARETGTNSHTSEL
jgi:hypothetical protein